MKFVKLLSTYNNEEIYVNLEHIVRIRETPSGTFVYMVDDDSVVVKESAFDILVNKQVIGG